MTTFSGLSGVALYCKRALKNLRLCGSLLSWGLGGKGEGGGGGDATSRRSCSQMHCCFFRTYIKCVFEGGFESVNGRG